jgi:hypothetical protein
VRTQIPGKQILDKGIDTADIADGSVNDEKLSPSGVGAGTYTKVTVNEKGRVTSAENPTTLAGYGITDAFSAQDAQALPLIAVDTGNLPDTPGATYRIATGVAGEIVLADGGVKNPITFGLAPNTILPGQGATTIPTGTTAQRPEPTPGMLRFNATTAALETPIGATWQKVVLDNDSRLSGESNVIEVRSTPKPGQFSSIAAACSSLVGVATAESHWLIDVGPGTYVEPAITIPPYVHVAGKTEYAVYVKPNGAVDPVFTLSEFSTLSFLNVTDAAAADQIAVKLHNTGEYGVILHKVCIERSSIGFDITSTTADSSVYLEYCDTEQAGGIGLNIDSTSTEFTTYVNAENFYVYGSGTNPSEGIHVFGPNVSLDLQSFAVEGDSTTGIGVNLGNGARVDAKAGAISGWDTGVHIQNAGLPAIGDFIGVALHSNTTWDLHAEHPDAQGAIFGTATRSKLNAAVAPGFTFAVADTANNAYVQTGDFYLGARAGTVTNVTGLIIETPPMGILTGGGLSGAVGLNVTVGGGSGYLRKDGEVTLVAWDGLTLPLAPNLASYIFVNKNGVISTSVAEPDGLTNIILGRCSTNATDVYALGDLSIDISSYGNKVEDYLRKAVGTVYVSGSIVTENATTPRAIDVTAGQWMYGTMVRNPGARTAPMLQDGYRVAGVTVFTPRNTIPNDTIDNGTDLVPMTPGYFAKHSIYQSSEGPYQTYVIAHAQAEYATLEAALLAPLPTPLVAPDSTPLIAAVVVQQGVDSLVEIIDVRPMFFRTGGVTAGAEGATHHGDLLGLADDDHLQYLLVNGSRGMSGDLNLGGNDITNVGLIDGFNLFTHAARHQPNGDDPLSTGPAVSIGPNSTNTAGISNNLSRADHTHAVEGLQPASTELTSLAAFAETGFPVRTAPNTWVARSITSDANLAVENGDGVAGNVSIALTTIGTPGTYQSVTTDAFGRVTAGTNEVPHAAIVNAPTTLTGYGITDAQPLNADLTALSGIGSTGFYAVTGAGTSVTRSLVAPAAGVTITNPDGIAGSPTFALANDLAAIEALSTTGIPVRSGADTWAIRTLVAPAAGITITNPAGVGGNITFALAGDLAGVEGLAGTGFAVRTAANTWANRSITTTTLSLTNGAGIAGNVVLDLTSIGGAGTYRSVTTDEYGRVTGGTNPTTLAGYEITDAVSTSQLGAVNGVATLDNTGKLSQAQIPALAISDTFVVASEAAMISLVAEVGDVAVRTDLNKSFILRTSPSANINNWQELLSPTDSVTSVNGMTGVVVLPAGSVTSVAMEAPVAGITVAGSPITTSGTLTLGLANDLAAVEGLTTTGITVRTANDTWTTRAITGGSGITVNNGDGVAGAPTVSLNAVGTSGTYRSVTTDEYGRVTSGTNPTTLAGYGISDAQPLDSDLTALATTTTTGMYAVTGTGASATRTLTAGTGISIANGSGVAGNPTISNTGVTSVGLSLPSIFTVASSPVTTTGTITATLASQTASAVFVAPIAGGTPAFRKLGFGELSNVALTAPAANQLLSFNGTNWVNSAVATGTASGVLNTWTLISGTRYYQDFAHNLGTTNVVITLFDTADNSVVTADSIVLTNANTVRVAVIGNSRTLRIVVIANGLGVVAGGSTPSSVITSKDGVTITTAATRLNFTGAAISVADSGSGVSTVNVGLRRSYSATDLETPQTADWAINATAPVISDPTFSSLTVRQFSNTTEQGIGLLSSIPTGSGAITFRFHGRAQVAQGALSVAAFRLYARQIPNGSAMTAGSAGWAAAKEIGEIAVPANANFLQASFTSTLTAMGLTPGNLYQFEVTRRVTGTTGSNLASSFLLAELTVELT